MKYLIIILLMFLPILLCFANVIETKDIEQINKVLQTSMYGNNVYIGLSPKYSTRDKEIEYAKKHIANQITMEKKCTVDYGYVEFSINNYLKRNEDSNIDWDDELVSKIFDEIKVLCVYYFNTITVVVGSYTEISHSFCYIDRGNVFYPDWVFNTPEIDGYYVGIGLSEKYSSIYKSMIAADGDAILSIAKIIASYGHVYNFNSDLSDIYGRSGLLWLAKANIYGFYVIDRWIAPDSGCCYTLAIAKKKE